MKDNPEIFNARHATLNVESGAEAKSFPSSRLGVERSMLPNSKLDLAVIRAKLDGVRGQQYWRSLDEVTETDEFKEMLHREFPDGASEWDDGVSRRSFLKMAAASLALAGLSACTKQPVHEILPYVKQPEEIVLGQPLFYATSMLLNGYATGVIVKSREGHPIKVDGNPGHPASLGASSTWMQASILDLYDPDRSQAVTHDSEISTWDAFIADLYGVRREHELNQGAGLRFLTETITSPTLAAQMKQLLEKFPQAKWHQYDPVSRANVREGARLAFGEMAETHYRFDRRAVILSLESDFLYTHPQRLRYTREFTDGRRVSGGRGEMNRLYVVESTPTVTGTMADHRLPLESRGIEDFARRIAQQLGAIPQSSAELATQNSERENWMQALVRDLQKNSGKSIVIAGEAQSPAVHVLAHLLNDKLGNIGNTVFYTSPVEAQPVNELESLRELVCEMKTGAVRTLVMLGGNPVYTAPADFEFSELLPNVQHSIHLGLELDETAMLCTWHIPQTHYLESWSDARSFDGTVSLMQPLIAPLYNGKSAHELLAAMLEPQSPQRSDYEIVREFWRAQNVWPDFEQGWRRALHDGLIAGTELPEKQFTLSVKPGDLERSNQQSTQDKILPLPGGENRDEGKRGNGVAAGEGKTPNIQPSTPTLEVTFRADPSLWDGRFANNGWLQECAKPVNKLTWDNAVIISSTLAQRLDLVTDDVVELTFQQRSLRGPVWVMPGQAENSITLHLGYGREHVGRVGADVGFNAYRLRTSDSFWRADGVTITKLNTQHHLVTTQTHHNLHSEERQIFRQGTLAEFKADPQFIKKSIEAPRPEQTLYNTNEFKYDGYKWAMSIDLNTCIGCNACLLACNVENNIPVVGKDQVKLNREMFWIRIDTYYKGPLDNPEFNHMPVPCMQCEHAPCELVCPVAATVHDHEGLNLQIYNRCVGTRFCSNNCPYKVRRFNFLRYTDYQTPSFKPMYNPEVTVRSRGVMEKCTYCVQRIASSRITAEKENRNIREGEVVTACQQACPAQAIIFGDLNAPLSKVAKLKEHPLDYSMLGELNTRPRTTYLAKLQNRNAEIATTPMG